MIFLRRSVHPSTRRLCTVFPARGASFTRGISSVSTWEPFTRLLRDAAVTLAIGDVDGETHRLLEVTEEALMAGIAQAREGNRLWHVIRAIQTHVEGEGFNVLREYQDTGSGAKCTKNPISLISWARAVGGPRIIPFCQG